MGTFSGKILILITCGLLRVGHVVDAQADHILLRHRYRRQQSHILHPGCPPDPIGFLPGGVFQKLLFRICHLPDSFQHGLVLRPDGFNGKYPLMILADQSDTNLMFYPVCN